MRLPLASALISFAVVLVVVRVGFLEPAGREEQATILIPIAGLGVGLLVRRWWVLVLALVAPFGLPRQYTAGEIVVLTVPAVAILTFMGLALGVLVARFAPSRPARGSGAVLLGLCLLSIPVGVVRHLSPLDAVPEAPLLVDVVTGRAGDVYIGEPARDIRRAGIFAGDSISYDQPWPGIWVGLDRGSVVDISLYESRYQTGEGVGVGDAMAHARNVYPDLLCSRDSTGEPICAGRAGGNMLILEGNPIDRMDLTSRGCEWEITLSSEDDCPQSHHFLTLIPD